MTTMFFPSDTHPGALQLSLHIIRLLLGLRGHRSSFLLPRQFPFITPIKSLVLGMIRANSWSNWVLFGCSEGDSQVQSKYENMGDERLFWKLLLYWDLDVKPGWSQKRENIQPVAAVSAWWVPAVR